MRRRTMNQLCALAALSVHAPRSLSACVHHITCTVLFMGICVQEDMEVQVYYRQKAACRLGCFNRQAAFNYKIWKMKQQYDTMANMGRITEREL